MFWTLKIQSSGEPKLKSAAHRVRPENLPDATQIFTTAQPRHTDKQQQSLLKADLQTHFNLIETKPAHFKFSCTL